jgi:photosystem II stability/assembly factor-like uncharacterized protein
MPECFYDKVTLGVACIFLSLLIAACGSSVPAPASTPTLRPAKPSAILSSITPEPTSTPPPPARGKWNLYDPLDTSGWVSLYPAPNWNMDVIAFNGPAGGTIAGDMQMRYRAGFNPEWWRLDNEIEEGWSVGKIWAIGPTSPNSGWQVGMYGWLVRYEGDTWQQVFGPSKKHLWDIQMLSPDNGWIIGEDGTVWHCAGTEWMSITVPTTHTLYALSMIAPDKGWAVGRDGTILQFDGRNWINVPSPTQEHLRGLAVIQLSDGTIEGWAVGARGTLVHYQSNQTPSWQIVTSPTNANLHSVALQSSDNAWAVGAKGVLIHYDGTAWQSDPAYLEDPQFVLEDDLWDIQLLSDHEGWAVGGLAILHLQDDVWQLVSGPYLPHKADWSKVFADSTSDGHLWVLDGWQGLLWHYDGQRWLVTPPPQHSYDDFDDLEAITDNNVWLAVNLYLHHFDGKTWSRVPLPDSTYVHDLQMFGDHGQEGWAVGARGSILHYVEGAWMKVPSPTTANLHMLTMASPNEGWAMGKEVLGEDVFLHYTQGRWQIEPFAYRPHDWVMVSPREGWLIYSDDNMQSHLIHYQDGQWSETEVSHAKNERLRFDAIDMLSPDDGWIVGNVILHYRTGVGREQPLSGTEHLR